MTAESRTLTLARHIPDQKGDGKRVYGSYFSVPSDIGKISW